MQLERGNHKIGKRLLPTVILLVGTRFQMSLNTIYPGDDAMPTESAREHWHNPPLNHIQSPQ
jgi:hypothetical protein